MCDRIRCTPTERMLCNSIGNCPLGYDVDDFKIKLSADKPLKARRPKSPLRDPKTDSFSHGSGSAPKKWIFSHKDQLKIGNQEESGS